MESVVIVQCLRFSGNRSTVTLGGLGSLGSRDLENQKGEEGNEAESSWRPPVFFLPDVPDSRFATPHQLEECGRGLSRSLSACCLSLLMGR